MTAPPVAPARRTARFALAGLLAVTVALGGCSASGDDESVGTDPPGSTTTTTPEPGDEQCPPGTTGPDGSVDEPWEAERYTEGAAALQIELASGSTRCLEVDLDAEATEGWLFDSNEIDLRYGGDDRSLTILTYGEPMSDQVDARVHITLPEGEFELNLTGGTCDRSPGLTLTDMGEGFVQGRIDCDQPEGDDEIVSIEGTFRAEG